MKNDINKRAIENCTFVKTILMLLVIAYHCIVFWNGDWFTVELIVYNSKSLSIISQWLNSFHIYGFTLVSGYLFYYLKMENGKYKEFRAFLITKIKRLIVPYFFVATIWVVPITVFFYNLSTFEVIKKFVLASNPSQLWFLWMLFWVFIIFWSLNDIIKTDIGGLALVILLYSIGVLGEKYLPNVFCIWTGFKFIIYFWIGFKLRENKEKYVRKIPIMILVSVDLALFWLKNIINPSGLLLMAIELLLHIVGAISAFEALQYLANKIVWKKSRVFKVISKNSMPMYLFHQQIIYYTITLFNGKVNPIVNGIINFIVTVLISLVISNMLIKYKWTRFLVGEK